MTTQNKDREIPEGYKDPPGSIGPDDRPQNKPAWFDWDGELATFSRTMARQESSS